jgi:hypothetical protein
VCESSLSQAPCRRVHRVHSVFYLAFLQESCTSSTRSKKMTLLEINLFQESLRVLKVSPIRFGSTVCYFIYMRAQTCPSLKKLFLLVGLYCVGLEEQLHTCLDSFFNLRKEEDRVMVLFPLVLCADVPVSLARQQVHLGCCTRRFYLQQNDG